MAGKIKALLTWCQKMTNGYPNVQVDNFTTAWRNGLAFCAIIHRFRPDLIDFDSLSPENVFDNCQMAFETAERELSIPAFLEADDMVRLKVPDKLSIITYVSQYYNYLHALPQLGGPGANGTVTNQTVSGTKRSIDWDNPQAPVTKKASTTDTKASATDTKTSVTETKENSAPISERPTAGGEKCAICQNHVYLMERLMDQGKLYHRSCFRRSEHSPANKVYTRSPFLSKSLGSDTQSSTHVNTGNKLSLLTSDDSASKTEASNRQTGVEQSKVASQGLICGKKSEGVRQKHSLDEPGREESKKYKLQPRTLFDDDKKPARRGGAENLSASSHQMKESDKLGVHSKKETHRFKRRQQEILPSEKAVEQPKSIKLNMPPIFQDKPISSTSKIAAANPATTTTATSPATATTVTSSATSLVESRVTPSKTSGTPLHSQSHSHTSSTPLHSQSRSDTSQSKHKLTGTKESEKHNNEVGLDTRLLPSNMLPSVHNLQKMFSGQSSGDISGQTKPAHPVARPRGGTLRSAGEDAAAGKPKVAATLDEKHINNVPAHVRNVEEPDSLSKKPSLHTNSFVDHLVTPKSSVEALHSATSKHASSHAATSASLSEVPVAATRYVNHSSTTKLLQEKKDSLHPARHIQSSLTDSTQNKTVSNSVSPRDIDYMKSVDIVSNKTASAHVHIKQESKRDASPETHFTPKMVERKRLTDREQGGLVVKPAFKENNGEVLSGLLTSLAGVKGQNHIPTSAARTPVSTPSSNVRWKTEMTFNSASLTSSTKTVGTTSTTPHLPSQTNTSVDYKDSKNSTNNLLNSHKSNTHTTITISEHRNTALSTTTTNAQTANKVTVTLGPFSSMKLIDGGAASKCSSTDIKLTKPEKLNNCSPKSPVSRHENEHKHTTASKVPTQNINQSRADKSASNSQHNLKVSDKKPASGDPQNNVLRPALTNQSISVDESRKLSSRKHSSLSSSMESLLDINAVRLKSVMPERRKAEKEPRTAIYDVKLKKVDVIKGDTKWDSAPEKPQRLQKAPVTGADSNAASGHAYGDEVDSHSSVTAQVDEVGSHSSVTAQRRTGLSSELLQQKKDNEEIKKGLTESITPSQSIFGRLKHMKEKDSRNTSASSDINFGLSNNKNMNTKIVLQEVTTKEQSSTTLPTGEDSVKNLRTKQNGRQVLLTKDKQDNNMKLDWQVEAEKRMAALATFSKKLGERETDADSWGNPVNPQDKKKRPVFHRSEGDLTKISDQECSHQEDIRKASDKISQMKHLDGSVAGKGPAKLKDSKLEFLVKQTKLKSVEVDISVLPVQEDGKSSNDENYIVPYKNGKSEDFRVVLHQLKHVPTVESDKIDLINTDNVPDFVTCDKPQHSATKPVLNTNINENNNNKQVKSELSHISDLEHIHKIQNSGLSPALVGSADENGNTRKHPTTDLSGESENISSGRRKVPVQDLDKTSTPSPSYSSNKLKKIELTAKFDFEKSSDFEQSLAESTATLSLQDNHTPLVQLLSPDSSSNMTPNKISALELHTQLLDIDSRLTDLELKGRQLEEAIREGGSQAPLAPLLHRSHSGTSINNLYLISHGQHQHVNDHEDDDDELMIKWFSLINEKNDLVRTEAQLIYLSREMELESEQEMVDSQLRYLLNKPDESKSPEEKQEEEYLIQHKLELVGQRNMIVDSMDEDRIMYEAEDKGIEGILKDKGYWKDSTGTLKAVKGKKVARSIFYT